MRHETVFREEDVIPIADGLDLYFPERSIVRPQDEVDPAVVHFAPIYLQAMGHEGHSDQLLSIAAEL